MVAFNFQPDFAEKVRTGVKRQTVRTAKRCQEGDLLQLYVHQRSPQCEKLADAVCTGVVPVRIGFLHLFVGGHRVSGKAAEAFAKADGFPSLAAMRDWFAKMHSMPFVGWCVSWELRSSAASKQC